MGKNILVIDDDYLVVRTVEKYLKTCGYNVETAKSGDEAIEKAKKEKFDLIISDMRMPGMDGVETLKKIRESNLHHKEKVPAIIITGYAGGEEVYKKAGEIGIVECIYKPFELDEFIAIVKRNIDLPPKYRRISQRAEVSLPVQVILKDRNGNDLKNINGKTIDLSEDGIGLILDSLLSIQSEVTINLNASSHYSQFQAEASIVWSKPVFKDGYFRCGLHFLKIEDSHRYTLREILTDYKLLDDNFVSLIKTIRDFLKELKDRSDEFDRLNDNEQKQISFIEENKKYIFNKLDDYFDKIWDIVKDFERDKYIVHQNYYQQVLGDMLLELIEINRHVYRKPLGYPGDYIMMNYLYDYHSNNYLGDSSYEKFINNYTCNIPISCSNIRRKEFLKEKITEALTQKHEVKILSIACGPARELLELLEERRIIKPVLFKCLDFEKRALDFIEDSIKNIELDKRKSLAIEYICRDITSIIRDKALKDRLNGQNLIYAFGIFDYLSNRMATRLIKELFLLLDRYGKLIICNASLENSSHMAYYELLGEWRMVHRTRQEMLSLAKDIENMAEIKFEQSSQSTNYLFLSIKKL